MICVVCVVNWCGKFLKELEKKSWIEDSRMHFSSSQLLWLLLSPTWNAREMHRKTTKNYIKPKSVRDNIFRNKWLTDEYCEWTSEQYIYVNIERCDVFPYVAKFYEHFLCGICEYVLLWRMNACLPSNWRPAENGASNFFKFFCRAKQVNRISFHLHNYFTITWPITLQAW